VAERENERIDPKFQRRAVAVGEAQDAILKRIRPLEAEEVDLLQAFGRRLADEVRTEEPIPHFRRAGMDGYAVRAADIAAAGSSAPARLEVIERIPCGFAPSRPVAEGQAARIMTGAMVPDGADTVVMLEAAEEWTEGERTFVRVRKADARGPHIAAIGEEASAGAALLRRGEAVGPGQSAVLAALGRSRVNVFRKPRVAVLSTGTELLRVDEPLRAGKVRNSNAAMLAAQIRSAGGEPSLAGAVPDDRRQAVRLLDELAASDADLIVTTGGVSVGDYDIMADLFLSGEGTTLFNKVAMRPGSPTSVGIWRDKWLFGLSGNPSACFVGFELFVRPALLAMQAAAPEELRPAVSGYLAEDYAKVNAYPRYIPGQREIRDGQVWVRPAGTDRSSSVLSMTGADCLMIVPPTKTGVRRGELVQAIPLANGLFF